MPLSDYPHLHKTHQLLEAAEQLLDKEKDQTETVDAADELFTAHHRVVDAIRLLGQAVEAEDGQ